MPMLSTSTLMFILYDYITDGAVWKALTVTNIFDFGRGRFTTPT